MEIMMTTKKSKTLKQKNKYNKKKKHKSIRK